VVSGVKRRIEIRPVSNLLVKVGIKGLIMTSEKDGGAGSILLTPLLGIKARKSGHTVDASNSIPSICYLPSRSTKSLLVLERESVENATVSLHQVRQTLISEIV